MRLCGSYRELIPNATQVDLGGVPVAVCDPSEVLSRIAARSRAKDAPRAAAYQPLRSQPVHQRRPTGVPSLLQRLTQADG
jgi:hypothetical protein